MAKFTSVPFAMQEGKSGPIQNSNEHLLNMYCEPSTGRAQLLRRQRPCLNQVYALPGEKRCVEKHKGVHYLIVDTTLYSFDGTTLLGIGTMGTSTGRCTMIFNDLDEIMISDGSNAYYYSAGLNSVTVPGGLTLGTLAYLGGFGVGNKNDSGAFYSTSSNDFSTIDALDFATAEADPDPLLRVFSDHHELWLLGENTIEVWQLSGSADFPFQAAPTATIQRGIAAALSVASAADSVVALGNDRAVYSFSGYRENRISSNAVEEALRNCTASGIENAYAMLFHVSGQKFYVLTVPGEYSAMCNLTNGFLWSTAASYGYSAWNVIGSAGKETDYYLTPSGICTLSPDVYQDEGSTVIRLARSAPGEAEGYLITMSELLVDCEVGRAPIGVTPEVMLRVARDGETFGNIRVRNLGAQGNYKRRVRFPGLGQGRKPVLELSASGNFNFALGDLKLNATIANS